MTKQVLCMNPGPIEFEPRVLKPFAMEGISHVDKTVIDVFGQCLEKMRKVFLAPDGQPLVVAGSGTLGWDMVGANLVNQGDDVLIVNNGGIGSQPSVAELEKVLQSGVSFKVVTITHVDTSTGVRAHVKEFAAAIRRIQPDAVIVVDGVCATGGEETRMKQWDLDVVLTGSQKCIGVPAGLSLMVIRPRALQLFEKNTSTVKYYVDWRNWLPIMKNYEARQPSYFATPSVNHLFALNVALDILLENGGMEQRFKEHKLIGDAVKEAMKTLGCSLVTADDCGANTLTCVRYPAGVGAADFLPKVVKRGVSLAGGLHKAIKTEYFRIGHMGPSTRRLDHILKTVEAIEGAFIECGHKVAQPGKADYIKKGGAAAGSSPVKYRTIGQSLRQIHAEEGLRGYFKGNGANCVRVFPYVAIQFAAFEKLKPLLKSEGAETLTPLQKLFGGAIAGVVSVCVTYPLDAARARLTVQGGLANTAHTGIFNVLSTVVRTEGLRGVYRGVLPTIWGIAPYVGLNFTVFETLRSTVPRNENNEPDAMYLLACGALAGACGQTAAYPMDILRRRFQLSAMRGDATEYTSTLGGLRTIIREEGVRGLYKGLTPNFIKVVPSIAIMFTTNELLKRGIKKYEL
ncbi:unnamed protein product [Phytophthora lilii]|uniref:Unnamed protein product n=1 Tax=Phytophthora lilii TaxID=2077276 RepID=A0A9W6TVH5_9STRA|nr:unnamed protein product [Phytophthora lilii]